MSLQQPAKPQVHSRPLFVNSLVMQVESQYGGENIETSHPRALRTRIETTSPSPERWKMLRLDECRRAGTGCLSVLSVEDEIVSIIPHLRAYARLLTGSRPHADDLVQDALERAWRHRARFVAGTNLKAWVYRILRNKFTDDHRNGRFLVQDVDGEGAARLVSPADQIWRLQYADMLAAIQALPEHSRQSVLLVVAAGLTHEEAAAICNCPLGTLKSRVRRARAQLLDLVDVRVSGAADLN